MLERPFNVLLQLAIGFAGAVVAYFLGVPMPFLLGSLGVTAAIAMARSTTSDPANSFPEFLRRGFIAVVGVMIGQNFSPELTGLLGSLWVSLGAVALFVVLAHGAGYMVYRHLGGYDRPTAVFASVPGGLVEAITFGEQAGGNVAIVTVQHFARVILVIVVVPLLFWLWTGQTVGSAAGAEMSAAGYSALDVGLTAVIAVVGMFVGKWLHFPAPALIGPLVLGAAIQISGVMPLHAPSWLLNLAQLVIGVGLGAAFQDISRKQLVKSLMLGAVAMVIYLALGLSLALMVAEVTPIARDVLFISFAPGGVTEMSLIALSLGVGPIVVAAHHVFRISVTVVVMTILSKMLKRDAKS
ncbi:hypothetical protein SAMN05444000_112127 [Shimia gijangensis]|uniref:Ammonia monooxygenase n=1 Tax=Shimia gijangensis TaxID=1470563 RepID=A0A1M6LWG7_9RHOB|nr:AbrB family transcriptional regulator [Shimia gijangensis]SHJ75584.1 hypothetical protein SAMN05444000_112127 [Shimia gijangensis]